MDSRSLVEGGHIRWLELDTNKPVLPNLVEEEDPSVCPRHRAGKGDPCSPADEACDRRRVVRIGVGRSSHQPAVEVDASKYTADTSSASLSSTSGSSPGSRSATRVLPTPGAPCRNRLWRPHLDGLADVVTCRYAEDRVFRRVRRITSMTTRYNSLKDAADYFGVTPRTLRNWASAGKITLYRGPAGRTLRVRISEIESALRVVPTIGRAS